MGYPSLPPVKGVNEFRGYDSSHEEFMRLYARSLPEDHRRRYAALEALKIGFGGSAYVARVLGMSRRTIYSGIRELEEMGDDDPEHPRRPSGDARRIRRRGGGRPKASERQAGLEETLDEILEAHSAGSPTDDAVRWTDLKPLQLAQQLLVRGFEIGRNTAAKLLQGAGYRRRSLCKELITGEVDAQERDQQFCYIDTLRRQARAHGVYDYHEHAGFITLGTSHETSAFVCDAIALAWEEDRAAHYPHSAEIVLTFDCGGANAARSLRFKEDLVALSRRLGLRLRVAHYPPYTSKWHPIEHRLFSQVERSLSGIILDSPQTALQAVERTHTQTGLTVKARILDGVYELGRKCSETFHDIKDKFIRHDAVLGKWNYVVDANGFS